MPRVSNEDQVAIDQVAYKWLNRNERKAQIEAEAKERVRREIEQVDIDIAHECAVLLESVSKLRLYKAMRMSQVTFDRLMGLVQGSPVKVESGVSASRGWSMEVCNPVPGVKPTIVVDNGEHRAESEWKYLDDGSLLFEILTPEWSPDWKVRNMAVAGLMNADSALYASAVDFVDKWENGNA